MKWIPFFVFVFSMSTFGDTFKLDGSTYSFDTYSSTSLFSPYNFASPNAVPDSLTNFDSPTSANPIKFITDEATNGVGPNGMNGSLVSLMFDIFQGSRSYVHYSVVYNGTHINPVAIEGESCMPVSRFEGCNGVIEYNAGAINTPEPADSGMLLLGIAMLFGMYRFSRRKGVRV